MWARLPSEFQGYPDTLLVVLRLIASRMPRYGNIGGGMRRFVGVGVDAGVSVRSS
jgi:hypothetical protein